MINLVLRYSLVFSCIILMVTTSASADVIVADDFLYNQPTKELGPGGGFNRQDYGGGQNGRAGAWTGRWVSSGNAIITGPDFEEVDNQFQGLLAGGLIPVTANFLARGYSLSGLAAEQTIYFGVKSRLDVDGGGSARMYINAPLDEDSQIAIGFDEIGLIAELGLDFDTLDEAVNDGEFHQLVGKLDINAAGNDERLTVWLDPTGEEQGDSVSIQSDVIQSTSDLTGTLQLGRIAEGSNVYWDDVVLGTSWSDVTSVEIPRLLMRVNPDSGGTQLVNDSGTDFDLNFLEVRSAGGALNADSWNSLDDQNVSDGAWLENSPNGNRLTESNFGGSTTLESGESLNLGALFTPGGSQDLVARFGTLQGLLNLARVEYAAGPNADFNGDGTLDATDIDLLSDAVRAGTHPAEFDVTGDGLVDADDRTQWVEVLARTYFGDSNLDGEFNSSDFVVVFQAGQYEDGVAGNSTWATGDWNGDLEFDSTDFVLAFQSGGYELGPRDPVQVPEPSGILLVILSLFSLGLLRLRAMS